MLRRYRSERLSAYFLWPDDLDNLCHICDKHTSQRCKNI